MNHTSQESSVSETEVKELDGLLADLQEKVRRIAGESDEATC